jgi:hypothetical protein
VGVFTSTEGSNPSPSLRECSPIGRGKRLRIFPV